jgi:precorrin-6B methylase 2
VLGCAQLIAELYQEQEQDDRGLYSITTETVREQTAHCERSEEVEELSLEDFRRLLTYGEVSVESVSSTILPFLNLTEDDVLYDLGCGTGKILVQAVLQTKCAKAVGIELMQNRVQEGLRALERLDKLELELLKTKSVTLVQGDICKPPPSADMSDATVVFINNVMFGPKLMMKVMQQLESIPNLKRIVTLRKVCERHRQNCQRAGNLCANYVDPPGMADIFVSWASKTQVYMYERVDYSLMKLSSTMQAPLVANDAFLAAMVAEVEAEAEQPTATAKTRAARKKTVDVSTRTTPTKAVRTPTKATRTPTKTEGATTKRVRRR